MFGSAARLAARARAACPSWLRCHPREQCSSGLEPYADLQRYFSRRLRAANRRAARACHHAVVRGHRHVYFTEGGGIYRMDTRQNLQQVLNGGQEEMGPESQWVVQRVRLSPQEKHLAATLKAADGGELRCVVVNLEKEMSASLDPSHVVLTLDGVLSFEWATDDILFFATLDGLRCSRVFRVDLSSGGGSATSVYEETRPDVFVEVALSRDRQILSINCSSRTSSEVLLVDTTAAGVRPVLVQPRQLDLLYHVEHWRRTLIILANTGPGQEYQVVQAPVSEPSMASWVSVFAPSPGSAIKDMDVVGDHCVLTVRTPAQRLVLTVVPLRRPDAAYTVPLPSWVCTVEAKRPGLSDQGRVLELLLSSPVHPPAPCSLRPEEGLLSAGTEDGSARGDGYTTTRLEACSQDGTLVPVTLLHAGPVHGLRQAPLLAHVYGAYGRDVHMDFSPEKRLLLEQGWALGYCHVRGGGERGLSWQRQARGEGKLKGVEDLQACLQHLFSSGVSSPSLTALTACSAGAVPVGVLCNRQPHMLRAVTLQAPFLDVSGTMEDTSLLLTLEDREEWGDPLRNPKHRLSIRSYCPLHNITAQCYPSMLLTAYSSDARVPLAGVLKYTEQLRTAVHSHFSTGPESGKPAPNIVLNVRPGANHMGPDDGELMLEEEALSLAFLHKELGIDPRRRRRRTQ